MDFDFAGATQTAFDHLLRGKELTVMDRGVLIAALLTLVMVMKDEPEAVAKASKAAEAFIQREHNAYLH